MSWLRNAIILINLSFTTDEGSDIPPALTRHHLDDDNDDDNINNNAGWGGGKSEVQEPTRVRWFARVRHE